jgi:hypothetical protein
MKVFLVVMFLMSDGTWLPGDLIAPNGWSSIQYNSMEQCEERRDVLNENMSKTPFKDQIKGICQIHDPKLPTVQS